MTDQPAEFAALFPEHHWVYGPGMDMDADQCDSGGRPAHRRRQFGNMLLTRAPILASRNHLLPKMALSEEMSLQRAALEAVIEAPSGPLRVYSVHLNHSSAAERLDQIARLGGIIANARAEGGAWTGRSYNAVWELDGPQPPLPERAVLLGDFNLVPGSGEYERLCTSDAGACGFLDSWSALGQAPEEGWSCLTSRGRVRLDYAFVTPDLGGALRAMSVDHDAQGSDHQPIRVEIEL
jgi:endonuclease/exonuclease/phosphatase family metal-dependent hydrolase